MDNDTLRRPSFRDRLAAKGPLLADGAMGTSLFELGLLSGESPERWNLDQPDRVGDVHRRYIEAGCDIVLTNSFGGTAFRLKLHGLQDDVHEINRAAAAIARTSCRGRNVIVAGSMGPTGELLEPMGNLTDEACTTAFAAQAEGLESGGVDVFWLETLSDLGEVRAAVRGIRRVSDLPVVATMSFDTNGRTMMGLTATELANAAVELGLDAFGANCGNNLADTELALAEMRNVAPDWPLISKANAGIPEWKGAGLTYSGTPEVMAAHAGRLGKLGIRIIGGCCGSAAEHLAHMRQVLDGTVEAPDIDAPSASVAPKRERKRRGRARS